MPQFDVKNRSDVGSYVSKAMGDQAAKNPNGPKSSKKPSKNPSPSVAAKPARPSVPAVRGSLNYYMKKTMADGKGNARNRAYALWKRDKANRARGGR